MAENFIALISKELTCAKHHFRYYVTVSHTVALLNQEAEIQASLFLTLVKVGEAESDLSNPDA